MAETTTNTKLTAEAWLKFFAKADVLTKQLAEARSDHAKVIMIGKFLSPNVDRMVPIRVKGRSGRATLRVEGGRSNSKHYYFEVVWDSVPEQAAPQQASTDNSSAATEKPAINKQRCGTEKLSTAAPATTAKSSAEVASVRVPKGVPVAAKTQPKPSGNGNDEGWD